MPFFQPSKEHPIVIDYNRYDPICVLSYTTTEGEVTPLLFKCKNPDESISTVHINQITNRKESIAILEFHCLCEYYGALKKVVLRFYKEYFIWVMAK